MGEDNIEPTLFHHLLIPYNLNILSLSTDLSGRYASLLSEKAIHIVDLEDPYDVFLTHPLPTKIKTSISQWNTDRLIASSSHHDTLIWHIEQDTISLQSTIKSHQKSVSDLSWSCFLPYLIATSSRDKYAYIWDIRSHNDLSKANKVRTYCGWTKGIQKVQFNKKCPHQIALVQDNEVCIYDIRREGHYLSKFECYAEDIVSFDWSYHSEVQFMTASKNSIKMWDISSLNNPTCTFEMSSKPFDFDKVLCTPFHSDFFVTSQNNDSIYLWSTTQSNTEPYRTFAHHTNVKPSFDWRISDVDQRKEYQLVTLTYDHHMKLTPIQDSLKMAYQSPSCETNMTETFENKNEEKAPVVPDSDEMNEMTIAPRLCGAQFFGSDYILTFGIAAQGKKGPSTKVYPTTCKEYFQHIHSEKKKTKSKNTISQYFYSPNMTSLPKGEHLGPFFHPSLMHPQQDEFKKKSMKNKIQIFDASALNPLNYTLATHYKIYGDTVSSVCRENAQIARKIRRKDLIKLWTLLAYQTDPKVYETDGNGHDIPWPLHPFGKKLLKSLVGHYEKKNDIQTLAMIACVLSNPISASKIGRHREKDMSLLEDVDRYDRYKHLYSEMLYRWGLYTKRSQVIKTMKKKKEEEKTTWCFGIKCQHCQREIETPYCTYCKMYSISCVICHKNIKGNATFCLYCGHGGHVDHMNQWFRNNSHCPSGCNCECKTQG